MERSVAVKKLGKLLGKSLGYRVDPRGPTYDDRAAAKDSLPRLIAEKERYQKAMQARREAILSADAEYQELFAAYKQADRILAKASYVARHYKITVGTMSGMFFCVKAEGDSWEEVIQKIETSRRQ